jgi:hypothetical protein
VLSRDQNSVHSDGNHGSTLVLVLDGHLGLPIWSQPCAGAVLANLSKLSSQLRGQNVSQRHQFFGLIGSIPIIQSPVKF